MTSMQSSLATFGVALGAATVGGLCLFFCPSYRRQTEAIEDEDQNDDSSNYRYKNTLVPLLKHKSVPIHELFRRGYGPVLEIVRVLIGVVPNCDEYLEIWPAAFRTYNYMVPNFFNIPIFSLHIGKVYREASLANYVASRAAHCSYCSAHTSSYAIRQGNKRNVVEDAILNDTKNRHLSSKDRAVISVARGLGRVPCTLIQKDIDELLKYFSPTEAEWIACGAIGMGFLNKVNDSIGVELEKVTYLETQALLGPGFSPGKAGHNLENLDTGKATTVEKHSFWTRLYHLRYIPGAVYLEQKAARGQGISYDAVASCQKLREAVGGYGFPVLKRVRNGRVVFAVAGMLIENLSNTGENNIPVATKVLLGICFARMIQDSPLEEALTAMDFEGLPTTDEKEAAVAYAITDTKTDVTRSLQLFLMLVKAISLSPAQVTAELVVTLKEGNVQAEEIVEVVSLIATLQLMHRLMAFYPPPYDEI